MLGDDEVDQQSDYRTFSRLNEILKDMAPQTEAVLLIAEMFRRFDFHVVDPARVRPAARLTTRPTEQIMMRVTRADA